MLTIALTRRDPSPVRPAQIGGVQARRRADQCRARRAGRSAGPGGGARVGPGRRRGPRRRRPGAAARERSALGGAQSDHFAALCRRRQRGQPGAAGRERRRQSQAAHQRGAAAASRELRLRRNSNQERKDMPIRRNCPVRNGGRACIAARRDGSVAQAQKPLELAKIFVGYPAGRRDRHGRAPGGRSRFRASMRTR